MQIVINIEPRPTGHLVIGTIVERIAKQIKVEHLDRDEFVLRAPSQGAEVDYKVTWGIWP